MIGRVLKGCACLIGGLLTAEGVCIVGNALAEDLARAKSGLDVVVTPTTPSRKVPKPKKGWGKK